MAVEWLKSTASALELILHSIGGRAVPKVAKAMSGKLESVVRDLVPQVLRKKGSKPLEGQFL